jgi:hypothetical protein
MSSSGPRRASLTREPIDPDRVRRIEPGGFAFLPNRFLRAGFFSALTTDERSLYLFLVLAADRNGISFYRYDTICSILQLPLETYLEARDGLIAKDLVAFDGARFQVLSLPAHPVAADRRLNLRRDLEHDDPATIRAFIHRSLSSPPDRDDDPE